MLGAVKKRKLIRSLAAVAAAVSVCSVFAGSLLADGSVEVILSTQNANVNPGDIININVSFDTFDYISEFGPIEIGYDMDQFDFVSVTSADVLSGYSFEYNTDTADVITVSADFVEVIDEETGLEVEPFHADVQTMIFQISLRARSDASGDTSISINSTGTFKKSDGTTVQAYGGESLTINVAHGVSTDATLSSLSIDGITMTPSFDPQISEYSATVSRDVERVYVNAIPNNLQATVNIDGADELESGENVVVIHVLAQDGIRWRDYRIYVNRQENYIPEGSGFIDSQGVTYTFMTFPTNLQIPEGFSQTTRTINGYAVPVFAKEGVVSVLVYVYNGTDEPALYFYNPMTGIANVYVPNTTVVTTGQVLSLTDVPSGVDIPRGFSEGTVVINEVEMNGYVNDEGAFLAYMNDDSGNSSFYYYDPDTQKFYEYKTVEQTAERVYRHMFHVFIFLSVLQSVFIVIMTYAVRKVINNRSNPRPKRV